MPTWPGIQDVTGSAFALANTSYCQKRIFGSTCNCNQNKERLFISGQIGGWTIYFGLLNVRGIHECKKKDTSQMACPPLIWSKCLPRAGLLQVYISLSKLRFKQWLFHHSQDNSSNKKDLNFSNPEIQWLTSPLKTCSGVRVLCVSFTMRTPWFFAASLKSPDRHWQASILWQRFLSRRSSHSNAYGGYAMAWRSALRMWCECCRVAWRGLACSGMMWISQKGHLCVIVCVRKRSPPGTSAPSWRCTRRSCCNHGHHHTSQT